MKTKSIGVLYEDQAGNGLSHDFFAAILDAVMKTLALHGYQMCFMNTNKECIGRQSYYEQAVARAYDGVVIACIDYEDPEVITLMQSGLPVVTIDREVDGVISVLSDNEGGMKRLMQYILEMHHKRIAYITGEDCAVTRARLDTYINCLKEAGITARGDYIKQGKYRHINQAAYLTEELLRMEEPPSCIIYSDDYAAIGGMNVLRARGLMIPNDISIAGYDGIDILSKIEPRITTIMQNKAEIGRIAVEELLQWIENSDYLLQNTIYVNTTLQKGYSVKNTPVESLL